MGGRNHSLLKSSAPLVFIFVILALLAVLTSQRTSMPPSYSGDDSLKTVINLPKPGSVFHANLWQHRQMQGHTSAKVNSPHATSFSQTVRSPKHLGISTGRTSAHDRLLPGFIHLRIPAHHFTAGWQSVAGVSVNMTVLAVMGCLLLFLIFFAAWWQKTKARESGSMGCQELPPAHLSAADAGFLLSQEYQPKLLAAALLDCVVHQQLQIEMLSPIGNVAEEKVYQFNRAVNRTAYQNDNFNSQDLYGWDLSHFYGKTFKAGKADQFFGAQIILLQEKLEERLFLKPDITFFRRSKVIVNRKMSILNLVLLAAAAVGSFLYMAEGGMYVNKWLPGVWLALGFIHLVFYGKLAAKFTEGKIVCNQVLDFRNYLLGIKARVNTSPMQADFARFEMYLPYAVALDAESAWIESHLAAVNTAANAGVDRPAAIDLVTICKNLSAELGEIAPAFPQERAPTVQGNQYRTM